MVIWLEVFVIIPTKNRPSLVKRALLSVASQTLKPFKTLIVGESYDDISSVPEEVKSASHAEFLINMRSKNLSGAVNTAIESLLSMEVNAEDTYVAILDDDDWWADDYLEKCVNLAMKEKLDLVVTGIVRHESEEGSSIPQPIPDSLSVTMFLRGNPGVQNSNLLLRFDALLRAGGFDENLESTTDRDLLIRLLDLGNIRYAFLKEHLVHHCATNHPRLSTYGSNEKRAGLEAFYRKYWPRMSQEDRKAFLKRSRELFGCLIPEIPEIITTPEEERSSSDLPEDSPGPIELVIGFTASSLPNTEALLRDIAHLSKEVKSAIHRVVVCDNTKDTNKLQQLAESFSAEGLPIRIIGRQEIEKDANDGKFSLYYVPVSRRIGAAYGRTVLHHYLYLESRGLRHPAIWILDDDIRLDRLSFGSETKPLHGNGLLRLLWKFRSEGFSIVLGGITGDPCVPAAAIIRTELVDLYANLWYLLGGQGLPSNSFRKDHNEALVRKYPDYYYDLTEKHFGHLETPFFILSDDDREPVDFGSLLRRSVQIGHGIALSRPLMRGLPAYAESQNDTIPIRGGNTFVFDIECLKNYPNVAPIVGEISLRRGDTLWVLLNMKLGGEKIGRRKKKIGSVPILVRHSRSVSCSPALNINTLLADVMGASFIRAFDFVLRNRSVDGLCRKSIHEALSLSQLEIEEIINRFQAFLRERVIRVEMNAWRIRGLVDSINNAIKNLELQGIMSSSFESDKISQFKKFLMTVRDTFSAETLTRLRTISRDFSREDLTDFLRELSSIVESYSEHHLNSADSVDITQAREFLSAKLCLTNFRYLSEGCEGILFTDGLYVYKYFYNGIDHFPDRHIDFLASKLGSGGDLRGIPALEALYVIDDRVVFKYRFWPGSRYDGGHLNELINLMKECRRLGIVLTNISPENVIVGENGLRFVDLGLSIVPFDESLFRQMCMRTYLMYRWHFRKDLKDLMRKSLKNDNIPEAFGFEEFYTAVQERDDKKSTMEIIKGIVLGSGARKIFDYGCGDGKLADMLAGCGLSVVAYDIDYGSFERSKPHHTNVTSLTEEQLKSLMDNGEHFDLVLCNRVLCTIADESKVSHVLRDIAQLVSSDGRVLLGVCNPFELSVRESEPQEDHIPLESRYYERFAYHKTVRETGRKRTEYHRPFSWYVDTIRKAGFEIEETIETPSVDTARLCPGSDELIMRLRPLKRTTSASVSLLIKASSMEWRTIEMQIRHIVRQLEGPQCFLEKIVVTDSHEGPFARQYEKGDFDTLLSELNALKDDGVIDRILVAPLDQASIREAMSRWFTVDTTCPRCSNGQPTYTTLYGFEQCKGDFIFQIDSDCIIGRLDRDHDYLGEMLDVFTKDPFALTVSLPVPAEYPSPFTYEHEGAKWRTEVRCSVFSKDRLMALRPLPNGVDANGQLEYPWHRSIDRLLKSSPYQSYRGGNPTTFFVHVPNERKKDINAWYNILKSVEKGNVYLGQRGHVDLLGTAAEWVGQRSEDLIFLVRGRNVPSSVSRRCLKSLLSQRCQRFGVILIDAASTNGAEEFSDEVWRRMLGSRLTVYRNYIPVSPIENIDYAIRNICTNSQSIIAMLDMDDALIGSDVVDIILDLYAHGADVTVGSMLRTDKHKTYTVQFKEPRKNRGGNVWQHLRTFRKYLYDRIPQEDLKLDGEWIPHAEDWAYMVPIVEMAKNPINIQSTIYFYEPSVDKSIRSICVREEIIGRILAKAPRKVEQCQ